MISRRIIQNLIKKHLIKQSTKKELLQNLECIVKDSKVNEIKKKKKKNKKIDYIDLRGHVDRF